MISHLNSDQYGWNKLTLKLDGEALTTLQSINLTKQVTKTPVYSHNRNFTDVIVGNILYTGTLSILPSDFEPLINLNIDLITEIPFEVAIVLEMENNFKSYHLSNVHFTEWSLDFQQGATTGTVTIPFIASRLTAIGL